VGESIAVNINSYRVKVLSHDLSEEVEETMQLLNHDNEALRQDLMPGPPNY